MKKVLVFLAAFFWCASAFAGQGVLYFYNWSEYIPDSVLAQFTKETGIKVVYTTYDSNEVLYAKIKIMDGKGYDVAVPSTYFVNKMRREGLLAPIDKALLPNFKNLDPKLLDRPFDPKNEYSVPYMWGTTGIGVNAKKVAPETMASWKDLWKPELRGRVLLQNDPREVLGVGLKVRGYSLNDTDPAHIEQAYQELLGLMKNVRLFNSESPKMPFLNGEVDAGMIWNGEAYQAGQENPDIRYIYPKEGVIIWMDSMVIPKNARNVKNAHTFINFLLRPEIAAAISEEVGYATPNKAALVLLPKEIRENTTVYPAEKDLEKGEFQLDVGPAITVYEKFWEKLKA
ncbi:MAG: extracellular solute-binding protein, partial [Thermodesulfobacteriota bacterium]